MNAGEITFTKKYILSFSPHSSGHVCASNEASNGKTFTFLRALAFTCSLSRGMFDKVAELKVDAFQHVVPIKGNLVCAFWAIAMRIN
jgi:hypothetical protein